MSNHSSDTLHSLCSALLDCGYADVDALLDELDTADKYGFDFDDVIAIIVSIQWNLKEILNTIHRNFSITIKMATKLLKDVTRQTLGLTDRRGNPVIVDRKSTRLNSSH